MPTNRRVSNECPIARTAAIAGDHWRVLILRDVLAGARRFDELRSNLGIASNILTQRLSAMVRDGWLVRRRYAQHPPRYEYEPTAMAVEFRLVLAAMVQFGGRWLSPKGETVSLATRTSGNPVRVALRDAVSGRERALQDVRMVAGPAASRALREHLQSMAARTAAPSHIGSTKKITTHTAESTI